MKAWVLLSAWLWLAQVNGFSDSSVHVQSKIQYQQGTSSTLRWVSETKGKRPEHAVIGTDEIIPGNDEDKNVALDEEKLDTTIKRPVFVCRARHNGIWVPGQLTVEQSGCQVSLHGKVATYEKYEILENVEDAARLTWVNWDRWNGIPAGAVAGGESFIARRKISNEDGTAESIIRKHLIGKLSVNKELFGSGRITVVSQNDKEEEYTVGEVLVETEPVSYELVVQNFLTRRIKKQRQRKELGSTVLKNTGTTAMQVDAGLGYDEEYSLYWTPGKATLKGLPTTIRLQNGTIYEEIRWATIDKEDRKNIYTVKAFLEPGTAVNVSLAGNHTVIDLPYSGNIVAIYEDGGTRARPMTGSRQEESMKDLTATYSQAYFLSNNSLVPTTTTTTTTTTSTTTTTTTTTTTSTTTTSTPPPSTVPKIEKTDRKDENMINDQAARSTASKEITGDHRSHGASFRSVPTTVAIVTGLSILLSRIT